MAALHDPGPKKPRNKTASRWRRLGRSLVRAGQVLGWIALVLCAALFILEQTGWLSREVERQIGRRLGPTLGAVEVAWTDLRPLRGSVTLHGLSIGETGHEVHLDRLDVTIGWSPGQGVHLRRAAAERGEIRVTQDLLTAIQNLSSDGLEDSEFDAPAVLPILEARDVRVSVETRAFGEIVVGDVDVGFGPDENGEPRISGRLVQVVRTGESRGGVLNLSGFVRDGNVFEVHGAARDATVAADTLPTGEAFEWLSQLEPEAKIDIDVDARYVLGESVLPDVSLHFVLRDGGLRLTHVPNVASQSVTRLALEASAEFRPARWEDLWRRDAWRGTVSAGARWKDIDVSALAAIGRTGAEGYLGEAWLHIPAGRIDPEVIELLGQPEWLVEDVWPMLRPRGVTDVSIGFRLPEGWQPGDDLKRRLERAASIDPGGRGSVAYHGTVNLETGARDVGFPMRVVGAQGRVIYAFQAERHYPDQLGIFDVRADHGSGFVEMNGVLHGQPEWILGPDAPVWLPHAQMYLHIWSDSLAVDDRLEEALEGLSGAVRKEDIWTPFAPEGGDVAFDLKLWKDTQVRKLATRLGIDLKRVGFTFEELPLPMRDATGRLDLTVDGREPEDGGGRWGLGVDLSALAECAAEPVRIEGRVQGDPAFGDRLTIDHFNVAIDGLDLAAPDFRELCAQELPELSQALTEYDVSGRAHAALSRSRPLPGGPAWTWIEARAGDGGLEVLPDVFPVPATGVVGRAVATIETPLENGAGLEEHVEVLIQPLLGVWPPKEAPVPVALLLSAATGKPTDIVLAGAGVDTSERALLRSIRAAVSPTDEAGRPGALAGADIEGHLDFRADYTIAEEGALPEGSLHLFSRRASIGSPPILDEINGNLVLEDGAFKGEHLTARLGSTAVDLEDLRLEQDGGTTRLVTRISATRLPLDREHLQFFVDEETLTNLIEDLQWRGYIDFEDALLEIVQTETGEIEVGFRGSLFVSDMFVILGVPVSIRSAQVLDLDLTFEGEEVRAWAKVAELYGQFAGRQLGRGSLVLTYVEPHLSIDEFTASLDGGTIRALGKSDETGGATFFGMDLIEPFPFWLSIELAGVDVRRFLGGVFRSDFLNKGRLRGSLRLEGDSQRLTGLRGSGTAKLSDSSLWAIPVFQALFNQLGFDTTAVFEEMECRFAIRDGVIDMSYMRVKSPLLRLVGSGRVNMDGRLDHDLEVRYSLVDKLGPLTWFLYKIQNGLLRISIGGNLERPEVTLSGILSRLFSGRSDRQQLPLPGYSALPRRF